jgi:hypothetical protein
VLDVDTEDLDAGLLLELADEVQALLFGLLGDAEDAFEFVLEFVELPFEGRWDAAIYKFLYF